MPYNKVLIGKIRNINYDEGIGEIVTRDKTFMFTIDSETPNDLEPGNVVMFRAEQVHNVNKAFFVRHYNKNRDHIKTLKSKTYIKGNE